MKQRLSDELHDKVTAGAAAAGVIGSEAGLTARLERLGCRREAWETAH